MVAGGILYHVTQAGFVSIRMNQILVLLFKGCSLFSRRIRRIERCGDITSNRQVEKARQSEANCQSFCT